MKTYVVGGAIRDQLLGLPGQDRDYLVVGATPEQMLAAGFKPVGKDFPVFLHPRTGCEYALARTERKTARGYQGFAFYCAPDVTLEDDLRRRDLTINALAREADAHGEPFGPVIDPYGGVADLQAKVFRHVSPAFAEDPVRILRLARFAARFAEFAVAPDTLALCRQLVDSGEVDALVAERVWQELSRGLMEDAPARLLTVLRDAGALAKILPEVDALWGVPQPEAHHPEIDCGAHLLLVVEMAARLRGSLPARFAALTHDLGKATTPTAEWPRHLGHEQRSVALLGALCERLRVPNDCKGVAQVVAREHGHLHRSGEFGAQALVRLLERCDALRKPQRFDEILLACEADARGRAGFADSPYPQARRLREALAAAQSIDAGAIAAAHAGAEIPAAIHAARVAAVAAQLGIPA